MRHKEALRLEIEWCTREGEGEEGEGEEGEGEEEEEEEEEKHEQMRT